MNARVAPIDNIQALPRRLMKMIVVIATRPGDSYAKRVERLRECSFCTDDVKFDVLKNNDRISEELYKCLYDLYFGTVKEPEKPFEPKPIETYNEDKRTILDGFTEVESTEIIEPSKAKRGYSKRMDEADTLTLIHLYLKGTPINELAKMYGRTNKQIIDKIHGCKKNKKYKEMFIKMGNKNAPESKPEKDTAADPQEMEAKFEEIIKSVDAGSRKEPEIKDEDAPEPFCAEGTGLISTDGSIKLDDEPILAALRKEMVDSGNVQFYGTVQIIITPHKPTGMKVTRGCRE